MYKTISKTAYKQTFNPEPLRRCWKECLEKSSFYARKQAAEEFNKKNFWKKRGLAIVPMKFTIGIPIAFYNQVRCGQHVLFRGLSKWLTLLKRQSCTARGIMGQPCCSLWGQTCEGQFLLSGDCTDLGKGWVHGYRGRTAGLSS